MIGFVEFHCIIDFVLAVLFMAGLTVFVEICLFCGIQLQNRHILTVFLLILEHDIFL